jgi:hypothetical protein
MTFAQRRNRLTTHFSEHLPIFKRHISVRTYLLTYLLTNSKEQIPSWESNWFSASQEIPQFLWNPRVHYRIHKCPPTVPNLSQLDPVHNPTSHFLRLHLRPSLASGPFPSSFPNTTLYMPLPICETCSAHLFHSFPVVGQNTAHVEESYDNRHLLAKYVPYCQ